MKLIILAFCTTLVLFTSCNSSQKNKPTTDTKEESPAIEITDKNTTMKNTKWKLMTLMGLDVSDKQAFITFSEDNTVFGNTGCNSFNGNYEDLPGLKVSIGQMAATLRACEDMEIEKQFMAVLEKADNYSLQGITMSLNKARMAPLATFEAITEE
ncbi:META domain-containing protein [Cellulophaga sp. F20128]|uniref:META domain-containing protein n=1 Tax=Cellulophaga sp. F20128 TaxID=2926413 RepID=UPI001FF5197C|nr:META domain-containing protein [Cellulophaga sp. F20128]MCK0155678.1 META domain-containing protein [Cellulophaga sp. F20128]